MARILSNGEWYEQVAPASLYEAEFEEVVLQNAPVLFPDHILVPFKVLLCSDEDSAMADMALVDKSYREWWLVEAEMAHHPLETHVLPQIRTLSRSAFGDAEADAMIRQSAELDPVGVREMVKGKSPRVLVILNAAAPHWILPLHRYDAELAVVEIFRSSLNHRVIRAEGFFPTAPFENSSECSLDPLLPGFLQIHSPAAVGLPNKEKISIGFEGCTTSWERVDSKDRVWLAPIGANPLKPNERYWLTRTKDGALEIAGKTESRNKGAP